MISWDHVYGISRIKLISVTCAPSLLYLHFLLEGFQRKMRICLERGKMVWMSTPEQGTQQKTTQPEPARSDCFHWSIPGHHDLQSTHSDGRCSHGGGNGAEGQLSPALSSHNTDPLPPEAGGAHKECWLHSGVSPQDLVWDAGQQPRPGTDHFRRDVDIW